MRPAACPPKLREEVRFKKMVGTAPRAPLPTLRSASTGRWLAGENRQLIVESTLVGGPRFATRDIGGEVRIFLQYARPVQPAQHRHHQQVTGAERIVEPVAISKPAGKFA